VQARGQERCGYLRISEVVEATGRLFGGGQLLGSHLIPHFALDLLLALLAGLNAVEPVQHIAVPCLPCQITCNLTALSLSMYRTPMESIYRTPMESILVRRRQKWL